MTWRGAAAIAAVLVVATVAAWTWRDRSDAAPPPPMASGADLFLAKGCGACHDGPGHEGSADMGPDLGDLADRATEAYVRQSVRDPDAVVVASGFSGPGVDGSPMPVIAMDDATLDAIVAYLMSPAS